jgi:hypothetical protein
MCNFKSEVEKYTELMDHYSASFQSIEQEIELIKEKFTVMLRKDAALKSIGIEHTNELGSQLATYNSEGCATS